MQDECFFGKLAYDRGHHETMPRGPWRMVRVWRVEESTPSLQGSGWIPLPGEGVLAERVPEAFLSGVLYLSHDAFNNIQAKMS